jgi:hypothetical protein
LHVGDHVGPEWHAPCITVAGDWETAASVLIGGGAFMLLLVFGIFFGPPLLFILAAYDTTETAFWLRYVVTTPDVLLLTVAVAIWGAGMVLSGIMILRRRS